MKINKLGNSIIFNEGNLPHLMLLNCLNILWCAFKKIFSSSHVIFCFLNLSMHFKRIKILKSKIF